jgi:DNA polymerase III epsilon subunit-like protein
MTPLRRAPLAILDWETTWLDDPEPGTLGQHPVSVAVVHCELDVADSTKRMMHQLLRPEVPIRTEATKIHGIDADKVKDAPKVEDIMGDIMGLLEGRILCAYNLPFDWQILNDRWPREELEFSGLCGLVAAKVADRKRRGKTLTHVCERRGISMDGAHDASVDTLAVARVLPILLRDLYGTPHFNPSVLDSVASFWAWSKKEAIGWEKWYLNWRRSEARKKNQPQPNLQMSWHDLLGEPY